METPILNALVKSGKVFFDVKTGEIVGISANDGAEVHLGTTAEEAEQYLSEHPNPEDW